MFILARGLTASLLSNVKTLCENGMLKESFQLMEYHSGEIKRR